MTSSNDDRTVAYTEMPALSGANAPGMIEIPKARLVCIDSSQVDGPLPGGGIINLATGAEQTVGRGDTCTYPIPSKKLSRQHARVFPGVGAWGVEDLNSTNGVRVNELKVKTAWLKHGDEVRIGPIPFRFELDQPTAASVAAFAAPEGGDDEDSNRTMMVGGLGAGKAIIEAARKAEVAAVEAVAPPPPRVQTTAAAAASSGGLSRWLTIGAGILVVGGVIAGGAFYYPIYQAKQEVERLVSSVNRDIIQILQRADSPAAQGDDSKQREQNEKEIQLLAPRLEEIWKKLVAHPEQIDLANLYARSRFLSFERIFKNRLSENQFDAARKEAREFKQALDGIAKKLPPTTTAAEIEVLTTAAGLADLASIVADYRAFVRQYPQTDKPPQPTLAAVNEVDRRRADFHALRKAKALEVDYLRLRDVVMDCDSHDLPLIDRWRATLGKSAQ